MRVDLNEEELDALIAYHHTLLEDAKAIDDVDEVERHEKRIKELEGAK